MESVANTIFLLLGVGVLVAVVYGPWQAFCVDWARQRLFEARDSIFDVAADSGISFDSPEYKTMRETINLLVRFAHQITWPRIVWHLIFARIPKGHPNIRDVIDRIPNGQTRAQLRRQYQRASDAVLIMVVARSPIMWFLLIAAALVIHISKGFRDFTRSVARKLFDVVQSEADAIENPASKELAAT